MAIDAEVCLGITKTQGLILCVFFIVEPSSHVSPGRAVLESIDSCKMHSSVDHLGAIGEMENISNRGSQ